ncbi:hypothetical protein [Sporosarcina sp. NPDC096371]|uniref:hypothetical protein n=1 Tax=Sporosarcina sp. NPDC096371 TaxID=3364530 RepID=UPI0038130581
MFKKAIPLMLMSGLVLTACANNSTVPDKNETPMEKVEDRTREVLPEVKDGQTGPNMDGLDNNGNVNGVREGVINDNNGVRDGVIEEKTTTPNGTVTEENVTTPNEVITDENLKKNPDNR